MSGGRRSSSQRPVHERENREKRELTTKARRVRRDEVPKREARRRRETWDVETRAM